MIGERQSDRLETSEKKSTDCEHQSVFAAVESQKLNLFVFVSVVKV